MNNIEKLAIEAGGLPEVKKTFPILMSKEALEAFAKALQSSEPVAWYDPNNFIRTSSKKTETEYAPLFTLPPSTITLEEHNKRIAELQRVLKDERDSANELTKSLVEKVRVNIALQATNKTLLDVANKAIGVLEHKDMFPTLVKGFKQAIADAEEKVG